MRETQPGPKERVQAYIENVEQALRSIDKDRLSLVDRKVVELAESYASDARHYLEKGDVFTSLACIAYAEGLLDALRWQGKIDIQWRPLSSLLRRPRVLVAGTFDIIHPGHIALLRYAAEKGRVYVIVARDETVKRMKGRPAIVPEQQRLEVIKAIRYVHSARLGSTRDVLDPVREISPDIIILGPDQWASEEWLREQLEKEGINARIERLPRKHECPLCSSSKIACRAAELLSDLCRNAKNPENSERASDTWEPP